MAPTILAVLPPDEHAVSSFRLRRVVEAMRPEGEFALHILSDLEDALESARREQPAAAILDPSVEPPPRGSAPDNLPESLTHFLSVHPLVPTAVWASERWLNPRRVLNLGSVGVAEVVIRGVEDSIGSLRAVLMRLLVHRRAALFLDVLPDKVPEEIRHLIASLLTPSMRRVTSRDLARRLHCDRVTLYRKFARAGLPPPGVMVGWARVFIAYHLIDEGINMEAASLRTGFSSATGLRRMAAGRLGLSPMDGRPEIDWRDCLAALRGTIGSNLDASEVA